MAGLIKRLFGRDEPVAATPDDIPAAWLAALDTVLAQATTNRFARRRLDTGDADRIRSYVVGATSAGVLARLSASQPFDAFFTMSWSPQVHEAARPLYTVIDDVPASVALRWARALDALHGPGRTTGEDRFPDGSWWPFHLACHALDVCGTTFAQDGGPPPALTTASLERLAVEAGWDPSVVVVAVALRPREWDATASRAGGAIVRATDFPQALRRHAGAVRDTFPGPVGARGTTLVEVLRPADDDTLDTEFADLVARLATSSAKTVRADSRSLSRRAGPRIQAALVAAARAGGAPQRQAALEALHDLVVVRADGALLGEIAGIALADAAPRIRALGEGWAAVAELAPGVPGAVDADGGSGTAARPESAQDPAPPLPQVPVVDWQVPLTTEVRAAADALWADYEVDVERVNRLPWNRVPARLPTADDKEAFLAFLASPDPHPARLRGLSNRVGLLDDLLGRASRGALGVVGVLKFMRLSSGVDDWSRKRVVAAMRAETGRPTMLECVALFEPDGVRPGRLLDEWCDEYRPGADPGPQAVHEFFTRFADLVDVAVTTGSGLSRDAVRARLYRGIATQPVIPASTVNAMLPVALGGPKAERAAAQEALRGVPGLRDRIVAALTDGRAEVRASAARWLGRSGDETVVPVLEKAFAKEKQDVARAAILDGLELLGRDLGQYLGREQLPREALKGLDRGVPAAVEWLDPDAVPTVRWADGTTVPPFVVHWLVVRSVRAKSPEPDAILRRYCSLLDPGDRDVLGQWFLDAWVGHDLTPIDEATARTRAEQYARWRNPASRAEHARLVEELLPGARREPVGSAIDSKGVLAVAAACGGPWAAPVVARYLKDWYGMRAAQCRALLGMLAHVDDPAAIQVLLSTSTRFRTKGIQDEALRLVHDLAERRGWTVDELADRTVPTAGFDDDGVLALDYGPRRFTAHLRADLTVELRSPDGAVLKALPDPRRDDDEAAAADAKKHLAAARKELKTVVAQQTGRLHEAMCTGRVWPADDWRRYLAGHPVVRHLVRRLVWLEVTDAGTRAFRPLDDGTLTDVDDEPLTLADGARVRLAHDTLLAPDDVARWTAHLADYAVAPLFGQFGQLGRLGHGLPDLPADRAGATELTDVHGHVLDAFALRGRATRLGWTRGAAEDGGVFSAYRKRFASIGLDAVLEFTGNSLPEENRAVALLDLWFARAGDDLARWSPARVPLGDVPPVLLSECRREVMVIAADGTGYDPDWERTTAW